MKKIRLAGIVITSWLLLHACTYRHYTPAYGEGKGASYGVFNWPTRKHMPGGFEPVLIERTDTVQVVQAIPDNPFLETSAYPVSTFSSDVDVASYSFIRNSINRGVLPSIDEVRIEEMINYFTYDSEYRSAEGHPYTITTEMADCPWKPEHKLARISLHAMSVDWSQMKSSNLVFLLDVSGSMNGSDRLPLVKKSLRFLVNEMRPEDKVAIVVYAGAAGLVLPSTSGDQKARILAAIDSISAGGSTAGGEGIMLAYKTARENFIANGNNRIILCTDGDFNVGASSDSAMLALVEKERNDGISISCFGFGMGNYKSSKLEIIADNGNGTHAYIDSELEARKQFVTQIGGTLQTVAKDVKLQVGFNSQKVLAYRLIGYENRLLRFEDFKDDKKDAGDMGSGHMVTALYEIVPVTASVVPHVENEKKIAPPGQEAFTEFTYNNQWMIVRSRYKLPGETTSRLIEVQQVDRGVTIDKASENFRWAAAVAGWGMILRQSPYKSHLSYDLVQKLAGSAVGKDEGGYRAEFLALLQKASAISIEVSR